MNCKFIPSADRTRYSGVTNMRPYYKECGICNNSLQDSLDFIMIDENDPYIKCGFCIDGYNRF